MTKVISDIIQVLDDCKMTSKKHGKRVQAFWVEHSKVYGVQNVVNGFADNGRARNVKHMQRVASREETNRCRKRKAS